MNFTEADASMESLPQDQPSQSLVIAYSKDETHPSESRLTSGPQLAPAQMADLIRNATNSSLRMSVYRDSEQPKRVQGDVSNRSTKRKSLQGHNSAGSKSKRRAGPM